MRVVCLAPSLRHFPARTVAHCTEMQTHPCSGIWGVLSHSLSPSVEGQSSDCRVGSVAHCVQAVEYDHHMAHAAYALHDSPFENALILVAGVSCSGGR